MTALAGAIRIPPFEQTFDKAQCLPRKKIFWASASRVATELRELAGALSDRLNAADVLLAAVSQSQGRLKFEDFTPLPCGDPNCAILGYLLRLEGQVRSVSEFLDFSQLQGFLKDKIQYRIEDLAQCGCEIEPFRS